MVPQRIGTNTNESAADHQAAWRPLSRPQSLGWRRLGGLAILLGALAIALMMTLPALAPSYAGGEGVGSARPVLAAGTTWGLISAVNAPGARWGTPMTYVETANGGDLIFGGVSSTGAVLGDTWMYNSSAWHLGCSTGTCGPSARWGETLIYADDWVLLYGGCGSAPTANQGCTKVLSDAWEYCPTSSGFPGVWTLLSLAASPGPRYDASAAANNNIVVVFGGRTTGGAPLGDTWMLSASATNTHPCGFYSWSHYTGAGPSARWGGAFSYDRFVTKPGGAYILFGGASGASPGQVYGDTWYFSTGTCTFESGPGVSCAIPGWTKTVFTGPAARQDAGMAYYPDVGCGTLDQVTLFGGYDPSVPKTYGDTWTFVNATTGWTRSFPPTSPSPRTYAGMDFDPAHGTVSGYCYGNNVPNTNQGDYVYGGYDPTTVPVSVYQDLWYWS